LLKDPCSQFPEVCGIGLNTGGTLLVRLAVASIIVAHQSPGWTVSPKVLCISHCEEGAYDKDGVGALTFVRYVIFPNAASEILEDEHAFLFSVEMLPE